MKSSTLQNKTVRPGLMRYSFYASERRSVKPVRPAKAKHGSRKFASLIILVLIVAAGVAYAFKSPAISKPVAKTSAVIVASKQAPPPAATTPAVAPAPVNNCAGNTLDKFIKVSISQRHLWACQGTQDVYNTPVVTGIAYLVADKTPVGTYHIYAKYTDHTLRGSDSTGSWNDFVYYWMPFLQNQYGNYGLHDATWRANTDFGNIDPNSANASHGCVELPLGAAKWLFDWSSVGTTVTVES